MPVSWKCRQAAIIPITWICSGFRLLGLNVISDFGLRAMSTYIVVALVPENRFKANNDGWAIPTVKNDDLATATVKNDGLAAPTVKNDGLATPTVKNDNWATSTVKNNGLGDPNCEK